MSVLSFPRLYLFGTMSWDPVVSNNARQVYDLVTGRARLRPGETTTDFRRRMIATTVGRGDWNYFGTNRCVLQAKVVGAAAAPHDRDVEQDALLKAPVELVGKLVDIDPAGTCSQIFFDELTLGIPGHPHLRARPRRRMSSRWLNRTTRNLAPLPIAGSASAAWQAVFPAEEIEIVRAGQSALLTTLQEALADPNAQGLMLRLCTYRTRYFGGRLETDDEQRALLAELQRLHEQGIPISNPAESLVVGALGMWSNGDSESVPGGRQLVATDTAPVAVGPAAAELHPDTRVLSLDLSNTIPQTGPALEKADLGPITVLVTADGDPAKVGRIENSAYGRAAYETHAGIVDLDLPPTLNLALFARGTLSLEVQTPGGPAVLSVEQQLTASCDDCNVYLDQGERHTLVIRVRERGEVPTGLVSLQVASYDAGMSLAGEPIELSVSADGTAKLEVRGEAPGCRHRGFLAFTDPKPTDPKPNPPPSLRFTTAQFTSVRTLPFDNALEAATTDQALTWEFVYANVLQTYDAIAPRMSVILDLGDRDAVQTFARRLKDVTAAELFESSRYMPVTRDLSRGKRKILQRFCDLALAGTLPAAQPRPTRPVLPDQVPDASQPATPEQPADVPAAEQFEKRALPPP